MRLSLRLICEIVFAEFAIVDEAYPYVAQRLLCDDEPRLQAALRYMVRRPPVLCPTAGRDAFCCRRAVLIACMIMKHCTTGRWTLPAALPVSSMCRQRHQ